MSEPGEEFLMERARFIASLHFLELSPVHAIVRVRGHEIVFRYRLDGEVYRTKEAGGSTYRLTNDEYWWVQEYVKGLILSVREGLGSNSRRKLEEKQYVIATALKDVASAPHSLKLLRRFKRRRPVQRELPLLQKPPKRS